MKLTVLFVVAACLQAEANINAQQVSLHVKQENIQKVFKEIRKQTGYGFVMDAKFLEQAKPVTIDANKTDVKEVLRQCFENQPFTYEIQDKIITVKEKPVIKTNLSVTTDVAPLPPIVHGRITNEKGEPVAGVNISLKGGKVIGVTNDNGEFTLTNVPDNSTLVFSAVTIVTFETNLNGRIELALSSKTKVSELEEVVVNKGYYSVKSKENTGSISIVRSNELQRQPLTDPIKGLEGLVPGLFVQEQNGYPGSSFRNLLIRGRNGIISSSQPLIMLDGVPLPSSSLSLNLQQNGAGGSLSVYNNIDFDDIESIQVLKDADATAIYGTRGANGVILITTKKGKSGKTEVSINYSERSGTITKYPELLNTQQYLQMRHEAFRNDNKTPGATDYDLNGRWDTTRYTNWKDVLIGNVARSRNADVSIKGGNEFTQFSVSGSYNKQTTVLPGNFYDESGSGHLSLSHSSANNKFKMSIQSFYSSGRNLMPQTDQSSSSALSPVAPAIYNPDGSYNWDGGTWLNPLSVMERIADARIRSFNNSMNLSYNILSNLKIRTLLGYTNQRLEIYNVNPIISFNPVTATANSRSTIYGNSNSQTWLFEPQIDYAISKNKHNISALIGTTFQDNNVTSTKITGSGFVNDDVMRNIGLASTKNINFINFSEYKLNKVYGRIGYNYNERYILNLTASHEGSSRFGSGNRFGNFGAIGAAYIFSDEKWIRKNIPFVNFGKIRVSYGTTGNDQIGDYQYFDLYSGNFLTYQNLSGILPSSLPNPYFGWETVKKFETGIELSLFNEKINLIANYFRNRTDNQLVGYSLPTMTGFSSITANFPAIVENSGLEFQINATYIKHKDFEWETSFNITIPKNRLVSFPGIESSSYKSTYSTGRSLDIFNGYLYTGVDPVTGQYTFKDLNSDSKINSSDKDFFIDRVQKYYGGLVNSIRYKNIQCDIVFQFVNKISPNYFTAFTVPGVSNNQPTGVLLHWQQPGDNAVTQIFTQNFSSNAATAYFNMASSTAAYSDASYLRLRNVAISYSLNKIKFAKLKLYIQGQNLLTFTKFKYFDPESTATGLPPLKTIAFGLKASF